MGLPDPVAAADGSDADVDSDVDPPSVPDPPAGAGVVPESLAPWDADRELELRSFLAQPVPLKWIVGAVKALRTGAAPQTAQTVGPSAVSEWMTSNRWPFGHR